MSIYPLIKQHCVVGMRRRCDDRICCIADHPSRSLCLAIPQRLPNDILLDKLKGFQHGAFETVLPAVSHVVRNCSRCTSKCNPCCCSLCSFLWYQLVSGADFIFNQ